jgi:hypothetical protein
MDGSLVEEGTKKTEFAPYEWNGRNKNGSKVVSGLYYLVLETPAGEKIVKRIIVCYECDPLYNKDE